MDIALDPSSHAASPLDDHDWGAVLDLEPSRAIPEALAAQAGLTLSAIGRDAIEWVQDHRRSAGLGDSPDAFFDFVIAHTSDRVVGCMARFERALCAARAARAADRPAPAVLGERLRLNPAACIVDLPGPAADVIGAVALGSSPPAYSGWPVLVAPGLPTLWRQATAFEDTLCTWLTRPRDTPEVRKRFIGAEQVLQRLLAARAIIDA